jgi:putative phage-type endonuclease
VSYIESTHPQRTPEWHQDRLGRATGSKAHSIFATTAKGLPAAARRDYAMQLGLERVTGEVEPVFVNYAMQRGTDLEPMACDRYGFETGYILRESGFLMHPTLMAGTSLDRWIGTHGVLEVKCPGAKTHFEYLQAGVVPAEYRAQCLHHLWITNAEWCDFASFHPGFPERLQLFVVRMNRADVIPQLAAHEVGVIAFLAEVDQIVADVMRLAA